MDRCDNGRRITGFVIVGFPEDFSVAFVERYQAGAVGAPDDEQERIAFDQWRAGDAEEAFGGMKLRFGIHAPDIRAGCKVEAVKQPFGAVGVNAAIGDGRSGARAFVEAKIVAVMRRIIKTPRRPACFGVQALDGFLVLQAMEKDKLA